MARNLPLVIVAVLVADAFAVMPASARLSDDAPVVVAVVDTGIDPAWSDRLVPGYNAYDGSTNTDDDHGHGTSVAQGIEILWAFAKNVCTQCKLMPIKIAGPSGRSTQNAAASGIRWAADHGAQVIHLGFVLSGGAASTGVVENAVSYAVSKGVDVVLDAGHDGSDSPSANGWAGSSPEAIRVTDVDFSDRLYSDSNHGAWVELGAHRSLLVSAAAVSATVALMRSFRPSLSPAEVKANLRAGCKPVPSLDVAWHCVLDSDGALQVLGYVPPPTARLKVVKRGDGRGIVSGDLQCGSFCEDVVDIGEKVTLGANPLFGSDFSGWSGGGCSGKRLSCSFTIRGDTTVTAVFTRQRLKLTVRKVGRGTVTSIPNGIACGTHCSATFIQGAVNLVARPARGYRFDRWQGACRGATLRCILQITKATTVVAVFAAKS